MYQVATYGNRSDLPARFRMDNSDKLAEHLRLLYARTEKPGMIKKLVTVRGDDGRLLFVMLFAPNFPMLGVGRDQYWNDWMEYII